MFFRNYILLSLLERWLPSTMSHHSNASHATDCFFTKSCLVLLKINAMMCEAADVMNLTWDLVQVDPLKTAVLDAKLQLVHLPLPAALHSAQLVWQSYQTECMKLCYVNTVSISWALQRVLVFTHAASNCHWCVNAQLGPCTDHSDAGTAPSPGTHHKL